MPRSPTILGICLSLLALSSTCHGQTDHNPADAKAETGEPQVMHVYRDLTTLLRDNGPDPCRRPLHTVLAIDTSRSMIDTPRLKHWWKVQGWLLENYFRKGDRFTLIWFHDVVGTAQSIPADLSPAEVSGWIQQHIERQPEGRSGSRLRSAQYTLLQTARAIQRSDRTHAVQALLVTDNSEPDGKVEADERRSWAPRIPTLLSGFRASAHSNAPVDWATASLPYYPGGRSGSSLVYFFAVPEQAAIAAQGAADGPRLHRYRLAARSASSPSSLMKDYASPGEIGPPWWLRWLFVLPALPLAFWAWGRWRQQEVSVEIARPDGGQVDGASGHRTRTLSAFDPDGLEIVAYEGSGKVLPHQVPVPMAERLSAVPIARISGLGSTTSAEVRVVTDTNSSPNLVASDGGQVDRIVLPTNESTAFDVRLANQHVGLCITPNLLLPERLAARRAAIIAGSLAVAAVLIALLIPSPSPTSTAPTLEASAPDAREDVCAEAGEGGAGSGEKGADGMTGERSPFSVTPR